MKKEIPIRASEPSVAEIESVIINAPATTENRLKQGTETPIGKDCLAKENVKSLQSLSEEDIIYSIRHADVSEVQSVLCLNVDKLSEVTQWQVVARGTKVLLRHLARYKRDLSPEIRLAIVQTGSKLAMRNMSRYQDNLSPDIQYLLLDCGDLYVPRYLARYQPNLDS